MNNQMKFQSYLVRLNIVSLFALTLSLMFSSPQAKAQTPAYSFIDKDWNSITIQQGYLYNGNFSYGDARIITGVSRDELSDDPSWTSLLLTTHVATWSPNSWYGNTSAVYVYALDATHTYNPSVSGAISKFDLRLASGTDPWWTGAGDQEIGGAQGENFVLMQNGKLFIGTPTPGSSYYLTPNAWAFHGANGLTASDFYLWGPNCFQTQNIHPDFSSSGSAISFGFAGHNSTGNYGGPRGTSVFYDNFSVNVYSTPEPNAVMLLLSSLLVVTILYRKRKQRTV